MSISNVNSIGSNMGIASGTGINSRQIDAMVAKLRSVAARASASPDASAPVMGGMNAAGLNPLDAASATSSVTPANATVNFADALKNSIDKVNQVQQDSVQMSNKFITGDNSVSLSDVMISTQKANISLQTAVQVRNKLVAAYNDIMNMQI